MFDNIILIGFMGTGKDIIGREVARKSGMGFFSTDEFIELKENKTVNIIFDKYNEDHFRKLEKDAVLTMKNLRNIVVATGGGTIIDKENRKILQSMGEVIHLDAELNVIEDRIRDDLHRPLIRGKKNIRKLYEERKNLYDCGKLTIDTSSRDPAAIADELIEKLRIQKRCTEVPRNTITVRTEQKTYSVHIGSDLIAFSEDFARLLNLKSSRAIVITNPLIGTLYLKQLEEVLEDAGVTPLHYIIPDGEQYKTAVMVDRIYGFLLENKVTRHEQLIALGGGVIGDLCGFVASTYKRGTPLTQMPSTLLAQVDASVGGKTGIDHNLGKNMIGTFYQPDVVISDVTMLLSLSDKEFRNGLAEIIKYSIVKDCALFSLLEEKHKEIVARDIFILAEIISRCVRIKSAIVEEDEREEKGIREILNYGHTVGHIIEMLTKYSEFSHGEAVAIGMVEEAKIARKNGFLKKDDLERIVELISLYNLPIVIPEHISLDEIKTAILQDKKVRDGKILFPLIEEIGHATMKEVQCKKFL